MVRKVLCAVLFSILGACAGSTVSTRQPRVEEYDFMRDVHVSPAVRVRAVKVVLPHDPVLDAGRPIGLFQAWHLKVMCNDGSQAAARSLAPYSPTTLRFTCGGVAVLDIQNPSSLGYYEVPSATTNPFVEALFYDWNALQFYDLPRP